MEQAFTCFMLTCMDIFYYTVALGHVGLKENWLYALKLFLDWDFFQTSFYKCMFIALKKVHSGRLWSKMDVPFRFINAIQLLLLMGTY